MGELGSFLGLELEIRLGGDARSLLLDEADPGRKSSQPSVMKSFAGSLEQTFLDETYYSGRRLGLLNRTLKLHAIQVRPVWTSSYGSEQETDPRYT